MKVGLNAGLEECLRYEERKRRREEEADKTKPFEEKSKNDVAYGNDVGLGHGSNDTTSAKSRRKSREREPRQGIRKLINLQWVT